MRLFKHGVCADLYRRSLKVGLVEKAVVQQSRSRYAVRDFGFPRLGSGVRLPLSSEPVSVVRQKRPSVHHVIPARPCTVSAHEMSPCWERLTLSTTYRGQNPSRMSTRYRMGEE